MLKECQFSIIIPTLNEREYIQTLIHEIVLDSNKHTFEIIIADGRSSDGIEELTFSKNTMLLLCPKRGRASQMNYAAEKAKGSILIFLHADCHPPKNFLLTIAKALDKDCDAACFRLRFDFDHWFLSVNAWFTRFNINGFRFGDQGLFVKKSVFEDIGGYTEDHLLMEDQEIVRRLRRKWRFKVLADFIITSARKYRANDLYKVQFTYFRIWLNYYLGRSQDRLIAIYKSNIKEHR